MGGLTLVKNLNERSVTKSFQHQKFTKNINFKKLQRTFCHISCIEKVHMKGFKVVKKPFTCKNCIVFKIVYTFFSWHGRTHTREKPFTCKSCEKDKKYFQRHGRIRTGEKPFKCKNHDKNLLARMHPLHKKPLHASIVTRILTGKKPFTCKNCDKKLSTVSKTWKDSNF